MGFCKGAVYHAVTYWHLCAMGEICVRGRTPNSEWHRPKGKSREVLEQLPVGAQVTSPEPGLLSVPLSSVLVPYPPEPGPSLAPEMMAGAPDLTSSCLKPSVRAPAVLPASPAASSLNRSPHQRAGHTDCLSSGSCVPFLDPGCGPTHPKMPGQ